MESDFSAGSNVVGVTDGVGVRVTVAEKEAPVDLLGVGVPDGVPVGLADAVDVKLA